MKEWVNWSGSLRFAPYEFLQPRSEEELQDLVRKCYVSGRKIKLAAAGHSSSPLVHTNDVLINLDHLNKLKHVDSKRKIVTLEAGITVHDTNKALQKKDLALFNTGDVDIQTLAGAISTGTHGTGKKLQNLASTLQGARMINCKGEVRVFSQEENPAVLRALRVSLGALGIITEIDVTTVPLFGLRRVELCTTTETCVTHFDELGDHNRNVDFYWYPRSDEIKIRILNEPGQGTQSFNFPHTVKKQEEGLAGEILPRQRKLKFEETEYSIDARHGLECFMAVRKRIREKHRREVAWRVLVRTIAKDDAYISPHYGRDSIAISIHHNAGLPYEYFFKDLEPIFVEFGGRPHWAKKHWRNAGQLCGLYPEWGEFMKIRRELDPDDFFLNAHLNELFYSYQHA